MANQAFLLEIGTAPNRLELTDNNQAILFSGTTYQADGQLLEVSEVQEEWNAIPRLGFRVVAAPGSIAYALFASDPGPLLAQVYFVARLPAGWTKQWEYRGILSEGHLLHYRYSGTLEHIFAVRLRNPIRRRWTHASQQARTGNDADIGLEFVHEIEEKRNNLLWRGLNAPT